MNSNPSVDPYPGLRRLRGFTYVEMLMALAIAALIIAGLSGVVGQALQSQDAVSETNKLTRDARFAMQRMVSTVAGSRSLLVPFRDNPSTDWPEHIREQTIPPSAPIGSSSFASAVLAVTLPVTVDLDNDGVADADNDADGKIDEDLGSDHNNDGFPGIYLVDDNGDGTVDVTAAVNPERDNDEDGSQTEDSLDGIDNDGDGRVDEETKADMNDDGEAGIAGVDDDNDDTIDESNRNDDDEDGSIEEDGLDLVVFYLVGDTLTERMPMPWDIDADADVDGLDYVESVIADNVTRFRVERLDNGSVVDIVELTLELTSPVTGERVSLQTRVRVGGAL